MRRCTVLTLLLPLGAFVLTGLSRAVPPEPAPALQAAAALYGPAMTVSDPPRPPSAPEVDYMQRTIAQVNPALLVEDPDCALGLPVAILQQAEANDLDWKRLFTLAWQESYFDCHAKNRRDRGGAFGPFQIRRLWQPVIGDPRYRYFDPQLAVERVVQVVRYYQDTPRYEELVRRRFRNPLLCLYNSGETQSVNMRYCRSVTRKMRLVEQGWSEYRLRYPPEPGPAAEAVAQL